MKISRISTEDIPRIINGLNSKAAWENPSVFLENNPQEHPINNDLIFKQIYDVNK